MKVFLRWAKRVGIVALALLMALIIFKNDILKAVAVRRIHAETGMDVKIGAFDVALLSPTVTIKNFKLYNTAEFGGSIFLDVPELHAEYDRHALAHQKLHLILLRFNLAELNVVKNAAGQPNVEALTGKMQRHSASGKKNQSTGTKYEFEGIDTLNLTLGRAKFTDLGNPARNEQRDIGWTNEVVYNVKSAGDLYGGLFLIMLKQGRIDFPKHPSELTNEITKPLPEPQQDPMNLSLIDKLVEVSEADVGYSPAVSGSVFTPLRSDVTLHAGLLGQTPLAPSSTIKELVSKGTEVMPLLIAHLDDDRETKIRVEHRFGLMGGLFFTDEYDYNHRTTKTPPDLDNVRWLIRKDISQPAEYRLTVGDLCFVAVGQIVNRRFNAVRYQPTAIINVSSPTHSARLRSAISNEWGSLTPAKHKASLVQDFLKPDTAERRLQAYVRLGYYYPNACEPLVVEQLHRSRYDVLAIAAFLREVLYEEKNTNKRNHLFEAYIKQHGSGARDGIMMQLFRDLEDKRQRVELQIVNDSVTNSLPSAESAITPRRLLVELYGFKETVTKEDCPYVDSVTNTEQENFIRVLVPDRNTTIDTAVYNIFITLVDEDDLALACMARLLGRGFDDRLYSYCKRRAPLSVRRGERLRAMLQMLEKRVVR